jgi:porin
VELGRSRVTRVFLGLILVLGLAAGARAEGDPLEAWWRGSGAAGDMFGAREPLKDHGLTLRGRWRGIYFGILSSENGSGNAFTQELVFGADLDLAKLVEWPGLDGLVAFGEVRWRDTGHYINPNDDVEADRLFGPSRMVSGRGWRLLAFGLRYVAPEMFGAEDFLSLTGGWLRPQQEFVLSTFSNLFANNALGSGRGLGGNIPFSSSFSSWGGIVEVKPVTWQYTKVGLFMSYPEATASENNGLMFQGDPHVPAENGLYLLIETGVRPEIGPDRLAGKYAAGSYYYGENNDEFGVAKFGFYAQADQMLWREPSSGAERSSQGLSVFSLVMFAPESSNDFTFYAQGGLAYEGALPTRDADQLMLGLALGQYSRFDAREAREAGDSEAGHTVLLEAGYRCRLNKWLFVQPFAQYIAQPDGTTTVANAAILGLFFGADF